MTAESLWDLFLRTGLPEAYSLYHQTTSNASKDVLEASHAQPSQMGHGAALGFDEKIQGT